MRSATVPPAVTLWHLDHCVSACPSVTLRLTWERRQLVQQQGGHRDRGSVLGHLAWFIFVAVRVQGYYAIGWRYSSLVLVFFIWEAFLLENLSESSAFRWYSKNAKWVECLHDWLAHPASCFNAFYMTNPLIPGLCYLACVPLIWGGRHSSLIFALLLWLSGHVVNQFSYLSILSVFMVKMTNFIVLQSPSLHWMLYFEDWPDAPCHSAVWLSQLKFCHDSPSGNWGLVNGLFF